MSLIKVVISCLLVSTAVEAKTFKVATDNLQILEPRDVYVDVYKNRTVHDPYISPDDKDLTYGSTFNLDLDMFKYKGYGLYWLNKLHFDESQADGRIKHAGWQYEVGAVIYCKKWNDSYLSKVEVFHQHHSRHVLEEVRESHFPVYDRRGLRLWITHKTN